MWQNNKKVLSENYFIHTYDIDKNQIASVQSICRFLLDSAGIHAYKLGFAVPQMFKMNLTWVLSRFSVSMKAYPEWRNTITVQTWPSGLDKLFAMRDFLIFDENRDVIGTANSAWLVIDVESRRPVRPQVIFKDDRTIYNTHISDKKLIKLPGVRSGKDTVSGQRRDFTVRFSDLDMNEHVTSISYIDWILETIPEEIRNSRIIKELEINYLSESKYGDSVTALSEQDTGIQESDNLRTFNHSLFKSKGPEAARARTSWVKTA
ncbi:MAG: hypothetical protein DRP57_10525 [Spirochaetes bacterium]|nr:MAG: hypothetical protein DRP57_10525 [Spirochaetota bacterium]